MPHLETDRGVHWNYQRLGEGPRVLLFIHGWSVDHRIWRQQLKFFKKNYRVLAVDLPGHGQSSWQAVSLEDIACDIQQILEHEGGKDLSIISSSLGGLVALKLADLFPIHIKQITFVGAMPKFARAQDHPYGLDMKKIRKLSGQCATDYPSIVDIFFRSLFTKEERQTRRFKWIQRFRKGQGAPMQAALVEYLDILEQEDLRGVLKKMKLPMQFINGTGDEICDSAAVAYLKELSPGSRFDALDQCGHFPFLTRPYEFNKVLEEFLNVKTH